MRIDNLPLIIGSKLRELRHREGISVKQLCLNLKERFNFEIDDDLMLKIELGKSRITIDTFVIICNYYGISLEDFPSLYSKNSERQILIQKLEIAKEFPTSYSFLLKFIDTFFPEIEKLYLARAEKDSTTKSFLFSSRKRKRKAR